MKGKREIKKIKRKFNFEQFCFEHLDIVIFVSAVVVTAIVSILLNFLGIRISCVTRKSTSDYYVGKVIEIPLLEVKESVTLSQEVKKIIYENEEETQEVKTETQDFCYVSCESEVISCLCKVVYGEARGCDKTQQAAVVWCILNRVEDSRFPNDIISVVTQKNQFDGYSSKYPVVEEIEELVYDVLWRYELEFGGQEDVGRVLPKDYLFFRSSGTGVNVFRQEYNSKNIWDWSWGTPYGES